MRDGGGPTEIFRSGQRPTWIELDLDALARNVAVVVDELAGVPLMAVVKAGAYGHGAVAVARTALRHGASWVATATVAEALELRHDGIAAPILVFGYTPPEQVGEAVAGRLAVTLFDREVLAALDRAGANQGRPATAHLKLDTGMSRLGIQPEEVAEFLEAARQFKHVELEGCYTHFRRGSDREVTQVQLARFQTGLEQAAAVGHHFRLRHAANSAAWHTVPEARLDLVRCGVELLGLRTPDGRQREPVLSFRTTVAQVRSINAGDYVGYAGKFQAERTMTIATLPVGYGDGFRAGPRNWGSVLIGGQERRLLGDPCMDMSMVDVTEPPGVAAGDIVTLIGTDGGQRLSAELIAERLGTNNYEVVTQLRGRVPREFLAPVSPGGTA
ncbi:MAG TPA: alanine racemase [Candidatus Dormibacteraeota bacterium]|nr:alanine racemase [Candidatus Dormibacteraeota bacterium]